jgi:nitric oxide reductase NorD protein
MAIRLPRLRREPPPAPPSLPLDDVRRRLEILLAAVYGREVSIVPAKAPEEPGWARRMLRRDAPPADPLAASDGERIHLPAALPVGEGRDAALARFRVMAIGQAERLERGTALHAPGDDDPLARDLYLLLESAAADAAIVRGAPGVAPALAAERAAALARRPPVEGMGDAERQVEALVRRLLAADPADPPAELAPGGTPEDSLARARALAAALPPARGRYRGVPAVGAWGTVLPVPAGARRVMRPPLMPINPAPMTSSRRGKGIGGVGTSPPDAKPDAPQMDDPFGKSNVEPAADAPPAPEAPDGAGSAGPSPTGGGSGPRTPGTGAAGPPPEAARGAAPVPYPEWDTHTGRYRPRAAWVRSVPAVEGDEGWAAAVLAANAGLVRRLRERFERLRAQRTRLMRQRDGDELDVDACVRALADWRTGHSIDDRLYATVRPARRGLAIALLVDISGSTSEIVGNRRIIDIEKEALLLTSEALDALGDLYCILTFSGTGAGDVRMRTLKDFAERNGRTVRQRISALRPEGYTRLGAAVRHASALLSRQHAGHRLLLILSDGKPNDQDHYQDRFAVEDSRQAIAEARASGVHPFCLTVDRKGAAYLARIFGEPGHVILRRADQLPLALVAVVRQILANR